MKKVIGYIRVSTAVQAKEGVSLEAQEARIKAWCDFHGYQLKAVFTDAGISGCKAKNRPGLKAALKAVSRGDVLVTYSLSRLARSVKDAIDTAEYLAKRKVGLVSITENTIDTTSATGRMFLHVLSAINQFEREIDGERTREALQRRRQLGLKNGGDVPFGYNANEGKLVPNRREQVVIAEMKELKESGLSLRDICYRLNESGRVAKEGKAWSHVQVHRVLRREA